MTETAATEVTQAETPSATDAVSAVIFGLIPADAWPTILVKKADGLVDLDETRRAFGLAVRKHLKATGQLILPPRKTSKVDFSNLHKAMSYTLLNMTASAPGSKPGLSGFMYAVCAALGVTWDDMDKAKDQVRKAFDAEGCPLVIIKGPSKFAGDNVGVKDGLTLVATPFQSWAQMHAAPAPAVTPVPVAPAPAQSAAAEVQGHTAPVAPKRRAR